MKSSDRRRDTFRLAVCTGGGDAPGLNAAVEGVVRDAAGRGWDTVGVVDGLNGMLFPDCYPDGGIVELSGVEVRGIAALGGTILGSSNAGSPTGDGLSPVVEAFNSGVFDALVSVGGDGSQTIARELSALGVPVVGVPKTIDRDLCGAQETLGFDTAVQFIADSLGRLRSSMEAHRRVAVVEVMGREAGWLALYGGLAGDADVICLPEMPFDVAAAAEFIQARMADGARSALVVIGEGAVPHGEGRMVYGAYGSLGGVGMWLAGELSSKFGLETRHVSLGHLLRGGAATATDRLLGLRLGCEAVAAVADRDFGMLVTWNGSDLARVPLDDVAGRMCLIEADDPTLRTALGLGVCFATPPPRRF